MPVMPDHWIRKMAQKSGMIAPFEEKMQRQGVISYGLSSYGYDARLADDFKIFTNVDNAIVDPKNFSENSFVTRKTDVCIIPPNSFVLSHTVEYFKIPRDVLVICLGKSTYARCGLIVNVTPLEPEWEGHVTLEVSNTTPLPAKVYANEGICQFLFLKADSECEVSYADRGGKYQGQTGVTLPRMEAEVKKESGGLMDRIRIQGGKSLKGKIHISGAKNSALKLMAASLLTEETVTLNNMPHLADITSMANLLEQHGVQLGVSGTHDGAKGRVMELKAANITSFTAPYDLVRKMRASIQVLGPLLARFGQAKVSLPGGCVIGSRPVDLHIMALERLGAEITLEGGYVSARAPKGLKGAEIVFPKVTMGGTETAMMAAALAKGETVIINAAREPEVGDLASCLVAMGAEIEGVGSDRLRIVGKDRLHGTRHDIIPDRLETGTFAMAAAITQGDIELVGARLENIRAAAVLMEQAGVTIEETPEGLRVYRKDGLRGVDMMTEPYPGFPTDLQAQLMALMCVAEGASMITETIFENRFMHVPELSRMGANITVHNASAMIRGVKKLTGAPVMATDIRASVSLVLAGLVAEGETTISRVYHLDRGYERLEEKLGACGANIERISDRDEEEVPHGRVAA